MKKSRKKYGKAIFLYAVGGVCILPVVLVLIGSFAGGSLFHAGGRQAQWSFVFYDRLLFEHPEYYMHFWNSVRYTAAVLPFGLAVSMLGGYGFAFGQFRAKKLLFVQYLVLMLMPFQATLVPQYLLMKQMSVLNRGLSVILPAVFNPFGTILAAQYMMGMDRQIFEAGRLDGLKGMGLFVRLALPLAVPVMASYVVLTFFECWAMIEQPLIFLQDVDKYPLSLRLNSYAADRLFPGSVIYLILPLLIFKRGKRALTQGIGFGAIR